MDRSKFLYKNSSTVKSQTLGCDLYSFCAFNSYEEIQRGQFSKSMNMLGNLRVDLHLLI